MKRSIRNLLASCLMVGLVPAIVPAYAAHTGFVETAHSMAADAWHWPWPSSSLTSSSTQPLVSERVIPGGQAIGIKLHAKGILVVGYHLARHHRTGLSPAAQAHIQIGDVITAVDGKTVRGVSEISRLVDLAGTRHRSLQLSILRHGSQTSVRVEPVLDEDSGSYRLGLFIRDSASGVGTLTFYSPTTHHFGALGHVIADADTGQPIDGNGQIVHAAVTSIDRGESGQPGEKRGSFVNDHQIIGKITRNDEFGVFGVMQVAPDHSMYTHPLEVARAEQVHSGPATLLTVVRDQRVEAFRIVILRVNRQESADTKGMIIKVTDPALLARTGGIVQGMSGSPIIQDGRLVGAVTHVFVSDPTQGYAIYAQWMVQSGLAKGFHRAVLPVPHSA